jgi:hypothetical protein
MASNASKQFVSSRLRSSYTFTNSTSEVRQFKSHMIAFQLLGIRHFANPKDISHCRQVQLQILDGLQHLLITLDNSSKPVNKYVV